MEHICRYEIPIIGHKENGTHIYSFVENCIHCGRERDYYRLELRPHEGGFGLCPTCLGRGEVSSGIFWTDEYGNVCGAINPKAKSKRTPYNPGVVWVIQENPLSELYSIAVCQDCRGCGLNRAQS